MDNNINTQPVAESAEIVEPAVDPVDPADEDLMLPEDFEEGKPYALEEPDSPGGEDPLALPEGDPAPEQSASDQPTVEQPSSDQAAGEDAPAGDPAEPTADPAPGTFKFTDTFQGMSREVELDPKDIPAMYRRAQTADFVIHRNNEHEGKARALGYESVDDMLAKVRTEKIEREVAELMEDNVHEVLARDVINRKYPEFVRPAQPQQIQQPQQRFAAPDQNARNIDNELTELFSVHPSLRGQKLPQEVTNAAMGGKSLLNAYNEFLLQRNNDELARIRKENETLRQNAAAAAKAPVKSVTTGGATDSKAEDYFLTGFESDK